MNPERETERLTPREQDVWTLMAQGLSNGGIAGRLGIVTKTVENHVGSFFPKLDINDKDYSGENSRAEAVLRYISEHPDFHNSFDDHQLLKPLSKREEGVLALVGQGCSNAVIVEQLVIKTKTVENHIRNILKKLNINREKQNSRIMMVLVAKAIQEKTKEQT